MRKKRFCFELYRDKQQQWRWRLKSSNGRIVADSAEGYNERRKAMAMIHRIQDRIALANLK